MTMLFLFSLLQNILELPVLILFSISWDCFHAYISELAKVRQSNQVLNQNEKKKILPNYLGFCYWVETCRSCLFKVHWLRKWSNEQKKQYNLIIGLQTTLTIEVIHNAI